MKPNPVGWFEIYVQDMPRAKAFYASVFQCEFVSLTNPSTDSFPDMGDVDVLQWRANGVWRRWRAD